MDLLEEIRAALNRCSAENDSGSPDFILAQFLLSCLQGFNQAVLQRDSWYLRQGSAAAVDKQQTTGELQQEFNRLQVQMNTPEAKRVVRELFSATPEQLGEAAVKAAGKKND